ncbi:mitogen-activated protein kinase kinase kinase 1-like [Typha angustifolia]|uniref:mitogen-activated protein kinase kinase kinase 1-like n=1 Tax=Typha angustifolia TaxID=59011 RepID=UPI003C2F81AD
MFFLNNKAGSLRSRSRQTDRKPRKQQQGMGLKPMLERRNASKHIDYDPGGSSVDGKSWSSASSSLCSESPNIRAAKSLDLYRSSYSNQTSFRIGGSVEGEVDLLCRSLGLSGPEEFAIPVAEWEARKVRCKSDCLPKSQILLADSASSQYLNLPPNSTPTDAVSTIEEESASSYNLVVEGFQLICESKGEAKVDGGIKEVVPSVLVKESISSQNVEEEDHLLDKSKDDAKVGNDETLEVACWSSRIGRAGGGIRGDRPPVLVPPRAISILYPPPSAERIVRLLSPSNEGLGFGTGEKSKHFDYEKDEEDNIYQVDESVEREEFRELRLGETSEDFTGTSSLSTNDDDTSSTTTETMSTVSPNAKSKRKFMSWTKGVLLGNGSFGTVYEAISDEGVFFAIKEVSLLDQGSNAQQCIIQLEQEITLLSQFEHENIVQYYGTYKEETKLLIFLELVTHGSLASLYHKYCLQDTQVSAYTRQILNGLVYLHDRNVVHRDIKCANILVHVNGSVKLADFGLAKEMTKLNGLKSCRGSVYWMAPEVINPKSTYGPAADIWSLGCTVLEMLTRQIPYPDLEWAQAFYKIGRGERPPLPNSLSRDARDFISQCTKVDPHDRPSASQLLEHPFVKRPLRASSGSDSSSHGPTRWRCLA